MARVKVDCGEAYSNDTGSGDVTLRVPENAGFELRADQGGGDVRIEPVK